MLPALVPPLLSLTLALVAAPEPLRVLAPTVAECGSLAERLARLPPARLETVRGLGVEGQRLCDAGHVPQGVAKLRRALRAAHREP